MNNLPLGTYKIRNKAGKFDSIKAKANRAFYKVRNFTYVTAVAFAIFFAGQLYASNNMSVAFAETKVVNVLPEKIASLKADLIHKLVYQCESPGYKPGDDAIIWDTNNRASVGPLKFQIDTVQSYYKIFYGSVLNDVEAVTLAMDYDRAAELGEKIAFEDQGKGINNWYNCNRKLGLEAEVNLIKKLSK